MTFCTCHTHGQLTCALCNYQSSIRARHKAQMDQAQMGACRADYSAASQAAYGNLDQARMSAQEVAARAAAQQSQALGGIQGKYPYKDYPKFVERAHLAESIAETQQLFSDEEEFIEFCRGHFRTNVVKKVSDL